MILQVLKLCPPLLIPILVDIFNTQHHNLITLNPMYIFGIVNTKIRNTQIRIVNTMYSGLG